jgi:hypothetical protein
MLLLFTVCRWVPNASSARWVCWSSVARQRFDAHFPSTGQQQPSDPCSTHACFSEKSTFGQRRFASDITANQIQTSAAWRA